MPSIIISPIQFNIQTNISPECHLIHPVFKRGSQFMPVEEDSQIYRLVDHNFTSGEVSIITRMTSGKDSVTNMDN